MIKSFLKINKLAYLFAPLQLISNTSKEVETNNKGKEKQILIERDEKEKKEILRVQLFIEDKEVNKQIDEIFTVTKKMFPSPFTEETVKNCNTEILTKLKDLIMLKKKEIDSLKDSQDEEKQKVILIRAIAIIEKEILRVQLFIEDNEVYKQIDEIFTALTSENRNEEIIIKLNDEMIKKLNEEMIIKLKKLTISKEKKLDSLGSDSDGEKQKVILTRAIAIIEKDILYVEQIIEDNKVRSQIYEIFKDLTSENKSEEMIIKLNELTILKKEKINSLESDSDGKKKKVILTRAMSIIEKIIIEVQIFNEVITQIDEIYRGLTLENKSEETIIKLKELIILKQQKVILTRAMAIIEKQILKFQQIIENNKVIIEDNEIIEQLNKIFIDLTAKNYDTEIHNTEIIIKLKELIILKKEKIDSLKDSQDEEKQKVILTRAIAIIEKLILKVQQIIDKTK
jgi:uncharacterized protein with PIN domain